MSRSCHWYLRPAGALLLLVPLRLIGAARADDLSLRFESLYNNFDTTSTDQTGKASHVSSSALTQRYYLSLDRTLFPNVRFSGSGLYQWALGSISSSDAAPTQSDDRRWNVDGRLSAGDQMLHGALGYSRSEQSSATLTGGLPAGGSPLVREIFSFDGLWKPDGLPEVNLILSHTNQYDKGRTITDLTEDLALLNAQYFPNSRSELRYRFSYDRPVDHLHASETTNVAHEARVSYGDKFFDDRLATYASYLFDARTSETTATGAGGTVAVQRFPIAGLSTIEPLPTPQRIALNPNPALIDGDTATSAAVNLGFSRSLAGDDANRDLGAQLSDAVTTVNTIRVWVDRPLPAQISGAFAWTAYQSDDNLNWTQVNVTGPVQFGLFDNRFEIPIDSTQTRKYVKVVVKPLLPAVTTDQRYADILVTEVQLFQIEQATSSRTTSLTGFFNGTARYQIVRSHLFYDLSLLLTHNNNPSRVTYGVTNGLSYNQRLSRVFDLGARVDRTDADDGQGHQAQDRWSASLSAMPLPTLSASLTYGGQAIQNPIGTNVTQTLSLFGRASPYEGIGLLASLAYSLGSDETGRTRRSGTATFGGTVTPNRVLTLTTTYSYSNTVTSGAGQPDTTDRTWRIDGTGTLTPFPALFVSAGASRVVTGDTPYTLANLAANFSPFPGGNLILSFSYNQSIDTLSESRSRSLGPFLRWNISARAFVELNYNLLDFSSPVQNSSTRTFSARLTWLI